MLHMIAWMQLRLPQGNSAWAAIGRYVWVLQLALPSSSCKILLIRKEELLQLQEMQAIHILGIRAQCTCVVHVYALIFLQLFLTFANVEVHV